jgi:hypothetical protein
MTDRTDADNVLLLAGVRDGIERMVAQGVLTARFTCPPCTDLPSPNLNLPLATVEPGHHAKRPS